MLDQFEDYLGLLPLTKTIKSRINSCLTLNSKIIPDDILEIFISDIKDKEGARTYTSLWIITDKYCMECKNFLSQYDFDVINYKNNLRYCSIKFKDFDLETATESSSLTVSCAFTDQGGANYMATGTNCLKAYDIYKNYFVKNIKTPPQDQ